VLLWNCSEEFFSVIASLRTLKPRLSLDGKKSQEVKGRKDGIAYCFYKENFHLRKMRSILSFKEVKDSKIKERRYPLTEKIVLSATS